MSDAAAAPAKKKATQAKKPAQHPKYSEMIAEAIKSLGDRKGSSRQAIIKHIKANYKVGEASEVHVKLALKRGVTNGRFTQVKGTGASGSFKLVKPAAPEKPKQQAKKPAKKVEKKKAGAKKPVKKTAAKKKTETKKKSDKGKKKSEKKSAKKSPAKKAGKKTTKSPAKKPAAKKPAKKPASKKSSKSPAKKSASKKGGKK